MGKTYTGIDIGTGSIKVVVCDGATVQSAYVAPLPEGLAKDGKISSFDAMADFLRETLRTGSHTKDAAIILPASLSLTRRVVIPAMTEKELLLNLPYEFRDYISEGKERYVYDYAVVNTIMNSEGTPESLDVLMAATLKQTIEEYSEMLNRAGLKLRVAMPGSAALQNLMARSGQNGAK